MMRSAVEADGQENQQPMDLQDDEEDEMAAEPTEDEALEEVQDDRETQHEEEEESMSLSLPPSPSPSQKKTRSSSLAALLQEDDIADEDDHASQQDSMDHDDSMNHIDETQEPEEADAESQKSAVLAKQAGEQAPARSLRRSTRNSQSDDAAGGDGIENSQAGLSLSSSSEEEEALASNAMQVDAAVPMDEAGGSLQDDQRIDRPPLAEIDTNQAEKDTKPTEKQLQTAIRQIVSEVESVSSLTLKKVRQILEDRHDLKVYNLQIRSIVGKETTTRKADDAKKKASDENKQAVLDVAQQRATGLDSKKIKRMTVRELKDELAKRGLSVGGKKADLSKRLSAFADNFVPPVSDDDDNAEPAAADAMAESDDDDIFETAAQNKSSSSMMMKKNEKEDDPKKPDESDDIFSPAAPDRKVYARKKSPFKKADKVSTGKVASSVATTASPAAMIKTDRKQPPKMINGSTKLKEMLASDTEDERHAMSSSARKPKAVDSAVKTSGQSSSAKASIQKQRQTNSSMKPTESSQDPISDDDQDVSQSASRKSQQAWKPAKGKGSSKPSPAVPRPKSSRQSAKQATAATKSAFADEDEMSDDAQAHSDPASETKSAADDEDGLIDEVQAHSKPASEEKKKDGGAFAGFDETSESDEEGGDDNAMNVAKPPAAAAAAAAAPYIPDGLESDDEESMGGIGSDDDDDNESLGDAGTDEEDDGNVGMGQTYSRGLTYNNQCQVTHNYDSSDDDSDDDLPWDQVQQRLFGAGDERFSDDYKDIDTGKGMGHPVQSDDSDEDDEDVSDDEDDDSELDEFGESGGDMHLDGSTSQRANRKPGQRRKSGSSSSSMFSSSPRHMNYGQSGGSVVSLVRKAGKIHQQEKQQRVDTTLNQVRRIVTLKAKSIRKKHDKESLRILAPVEKLAKKELKRFSHLQKLLVRGNTQPLFSFFLRGILSHQLSLSHAAARRSTRRASTKSSTSKRRRSLTRTSR